MVTVDHVSAEAGLSTKGDGYAIVSKDLFTGWLECYPTGAKSEEDAVEALQNFVGPQERVKVLYSDCAPELIKAAKKLK